MNHTQDIRGGDGGGDGGALGGFYDESGVPSVLGRWHCSIHSGGLVLGSGSSPASPEGVAPWTGFLRDCAQTLGSDAVWG